MSRTETHSQTISYVLRGLVVLGACIFLYQHDWTSFLMTLLIAALMTVPSLLSRYYKVYIPLSLDLGTVFFIFLTLFLGQMGDAYNSVPLWDKFLHLQSGLLLGAIGFRLVYALESRRKATLILSPLFVALFAIAFAMALGAFWEIAEFFWDIALGRHSQASLADTMWDLIADTVGGIIISIGGFIWMRRHTVIPFTPDAAEK